MVEAQFFMILAGTNLVNAFGFCRISEIKRLYRRQLGVGKFVLKCQGEAVNPLV